MPCSVRGSCSCGVVGEELGDAMGLNFVLDLGLCVVGLLPGSHFRYVSCCFASFERETIRTGIAQCSGWVFRILDLDRRHPLRFFVEGCPFCNYSSAYVSEFLLEDCCGSWGLGASCGGLPREMEEASGSRCIPPFLPSHRALGPCFLHPGRAQLSRSSLVEGELPLGYY